MPLIGPVQTANPRQRPIYPIVPVPPPPPPPGVLSILEILRAELPNEDDEQSKYIIPYYPPIVPTPPGPYVRIRQKAFGFTAAGTNTLSLQNDVTIGSLLIFTICGALTDTPGSPQTIGGNIWGSGPWTRFDPTQVVRYTQGTGGGGNAIYWKIADSTSPIGTIGVQSASYGIYEVTAGDPSNMTFIWKTLQASTPTMNIGTLPITDHTVTIMIGDWADTDAGPPFTPPTWVPGTGWIKDSLYWFPGTGGRWHFPVVWIASGNGSPASGTRGPLSGFADGSWSGIALVIPPV